MDTSVDISSKDDFRSLGRILAATQKGLGGALESDKTVCEENMLEGFHNAGGKDERLNEDKSPWGTWTDRHWDQQDLTNEQVALRRSTPSHGVPGTEKS